MPDNRYPPLFEELIGHFKSLPGIGRKSAERMAFSILKWPREKTRTFGELIAELSEKIGKCPECGNLSTNGEICVICSNPARDPSIVCVIEESSQIGNIENSGFYKGTYHVTGGKFSPLKGNELHDLNLAPLLSKIDKGIVKEIILALSYDMEGQATAVYIAGLLKDKNVRITRLAQGLPAGSDISYADSATLAAALSGRTGILP